MRYLTKWCKGCDYQYLILEEALEFDTGQCVECEERDLAEWHEAQTSDWAHDGPRGS